MASTYLTRTNSTGGNRQVFTFSAWVKRTALDTIHVLFDAGTSTTTDSGRFSISINSANKLFVGGGATSYRQTNRVFRDVSAWYHIVVAVDSTQSTADDRIKIYVNGTQETSFATNNAIALNQNTPVNESSKVHQFSGDQLNNNNYFEGYMADINFIDGTQYAASDFGQTDSTGIWKPKGFSGSYGTNGAYLKMSNSGDLGADSSGNGNNFTKSGNGAQRKDTPSNVFATWNDLKAATSSATVTNAGLQFNITATLGGTARSCGATLKLPPSGKWYYECKVNHNNFASDSGNQIYFHLLENDGAVSHLSTTAWNQLADAGLSMGIRCVATISDAIQNCTNGSCSTYDTSPDGGTDYTTGDIFGVAVDMDNGKLYMHLNGTYYDDSGGTAANPTAGTNENVSFTVPSVGLLPYISFLNWNSSTVNAQINFGNPGFTVSSGNTDDNGYGNFEYAPPTGYLALCTKNLSTEATPTIDDGSAYFHTQLYTGDGTTGRSITNDANAGNFQPDWLWIKERSSTSGHRLTDSSRGVNKVLLTDNTTSELTRDEIGSYDTDGFTIDGTTDGVGAVNESSQTYAAWQWKANGGTTSSNSDGSITSTVQTNTSAGFSVVLYTGNATAGATIGHGLGVKPDMIIVKPRSNSANWLILHKSYEGTSAENMRFTTMALASAGSQASSGWYRTAPTSSVFYVGNGSAGDYTSSTNQSGATHVAYCFAEKEGYSKFDFYKGNGNADGTFIYTGFRPAFVMFKRTDATAGWLMYDNKRNTYNALDKYLLPYVSNAEGTSAFGDFTSNGLKIRTSDASFNTAGGKYMYMAFAENPFVTSGGLPVTAR